MVLQITKTAGIYEIDVCVWTLKQQIKKRFNKSFLFSIVFIRTGIHIQKECYDSGILFYYKPELNYYYLQWLALLTIIKPSIIILNDDKKQKRIIYSYEIGLSKQLEKHRLMAVKVILFCAYKFTN